MSQQAPPIDPDLPSILHKVRLAAYTTLELGGPALAFTECHTPPEVLAALRYARECNLRTQILGGGSNVVFPDEGFPGLVIRIALQGVRIEEHGKLVRVFGAAGMVWDDFVDNCIRRGYGGIECLSGIPGTVGATPIQNVGAYGQEVSSTIESVTALDVRTANEITFTNDECAFGYRTSRFKTIDAGRYIITGVTFTLLREASPEVRYDELLRMLEEKRIDWAQSSGAPALQTVRECVLNLRRTKSMVLDPRDPESRSAGSFFTNPVISREAFERLRDQWNIDGHTDPVPSYPAGEMIKIPAAWLVERAGFARGYRRGAVGISSHHALALVNYGGSSHELLMLARDIRDAILQRFGIRLDIEPVIVTA